MGYGCSMYAAKAAPVEPKNRSEWANAGPAGEDIKDVLEIEDAVVAAIEEGAETYEDLYASINANATITGYDVDDVGDLFDEFNASLVSDGYA